MENIPKLASSGSRKIRKNTADERKITDCMADKLLEFLQNWQ